MSGRAASAAVSGARSSTAPGARDSMTSNSSAKITTPPSTPRRSAGGTPKGKLMTCSVLLLDDTSTTFQVGSKALGGDLFDQVVQHLNLLEYDYFGLEHLVPNQNWEYWIEAEKPLVKQISSRDLHFRFSVKFYTPDPGQLEEEYTRYLFALQVKRNLASGKLICNENTAALLASYIAQADIGDFAEDHYHDHTYLSNFNFLPNQSTEFEQKVMEFHRSHIGRSPAEADFNLLDVARRIEFYGVHMHQARDSEGVLLNLALAHLGIVVYQNLTKINTFSWAKIRKLSFKRKKFLIKVHPESYGYPCKDLIDFSFDTRDECKSFWKKCIEHHSFFRCLTTKKGPRKNARLFSRGSSFRYCGRTQKEMVEYIRENYCKQHTFERSSSRPGMSMMPGGSGAFATLGSVRCNAKVPSAPNSAPASVSQRTGANMLSAMQGRAPPMGAPPHTELLVQNFTHGSALSATTLGGTRPELYPQNCVTEYVIDPVGIDDVMTSYDVTSGVTDVSPPDQKEDIVNSVPCDTSSYGSRTLDSKDMNGGIGGMHSDPELVQVSPSNGHVEGSVDDLDDADVDKKREFSASPAHETELLSANTSVAAESSQCKEEIKPRDSERECVVQQLPASPPVSLQEEERLQALQIKSLPESPSSRDRGQSNTGEMSRNISVENDSSAPEADNNNTNVSPAYAADGILRIGQNDEEKTVISNINNNHNNFSPSPQTILGGEEDPRKKRFPTDKAYYIAKELLMTERTYRKDLQVLTVWLRQAFLKGESCSECNVSLLEDFVSSLYKQLDPLFEFQDNFLREVEQRLAIWEGKTNAHLNGDYRRIGDLLLLHSMKTLNSYLKYILLLDGVFADMNDLAKRDKKFDAALKEFENQKVCYLPITTFLLKPAHRLLNYKAILERLDNHYSPDHVDFADVQQALSIFDAAMGSFGSTVVLLDQDQGATGVEQKIRELENMCRLMELQRDLIGVDSLFEPCPTSGQLSRSFVRGGCLQKLSRKGYQQRMFFLFTDLLLYTSRCASSSLQFKVHGTIPVHGMMIEEDDFPKNHHHSHISQNVGFAIYGQTKTLIVAASSAEEKVKWIADLRFVISSAETKETDGDTSPLINRYPSLKSNSSSAENLDDMDSDACRSPTGDKAVPPSSSSNHRANTTVHVCWHRNTSVGIRDYRRPRPKSPIRNVISGGLVKTTHESTLSAEAFALSGYVLRKFKNSNGWQKLWVVFTNFCLFFYKTFQDDYPLASLPLLGYSVSAPTEKDGIHKDYVFKLQFKNHVYFFRAESQYTYERWMEVIGVATVAPVQTPEVGVALDRV